MIAFFEVISTSAPHIYHSALPLSPQTSVVHKLHKLYAHPLVRVIQGMSISWEQVVATVFHRGLVSRVAWSPCKRYIAVSRSNPATIEILDAVTLEQLQTFKAQHEDGWLSFSPGSRSLTHFNDGHDGLTTWDLQTGGQINTIPSTSHMADSQCFSSTYSINGEMVAIAYEDQGDTATGISIYNLPSGTHVYSYHSSVGRIVAPIWTVGECLQFVTVNPGAITIWKITFTSIHTLTEVESLSAPDNIGDLETALFLPSLSRLAYLHQNEVIIWDAQDSKLLLNCSGDNYYPEMSFSPDGCFFACETVDQGTNLWKDSPAGYVLHRKLISRIGASSGGPLLSPNGESIITSRFRETLLWHTTDPISSLSTISTQPAGLTDFFLEFLPGGSSVVTAQQRGNTVKVLSLKSGDPWLVIDTGVKICGMGVAGNAIVVVSKGRIITWNLPAEDHVPNTRVTIDDSISNVAFNHPTRKSESLLQSAAISPGTGCVVVRRPEHYGLDVYDMHTGNHLIASTTVDDYSDRPWITPDGSEVWIKTVEGWKIIKDGESNVIGLERLPENTLPSGGYPWKSPQGHAIRDNWWMFNSRKKRLMWLPHHWRKSGQDRKWSGQFLGLLINELPEPVIIELLE